ncbi:di-heme oxidoredictase family protein [Nostoc sp.]|uniref:di-heme oxidoredictase family protein n=1 Tax=Nostoc sp. TaxID=1180 RepID=UPI002FFCA31A
MSQLKGKFLKLISILFLVSFFTLFGFSTSGILAQTKSLDNKYTEDPVFTSDVNIDQNTLLKGGYNLRQVLESGNQFYTNPYTPTDGIGEGLKGPRADQRAALYPQDPTYPFLRLNGLDSQSCFECHNSIGEYREPGTQSQAYLRKPGVTGGPAGFASTAFINGDFPKPLTELLRSPPHVFGTGYTQQLADEITLDLRYQKEKFHEFAKTHPGLNKFPLDSKGITFGYFITSYNSATNSFTDDTSQVTGVASDLIVRPFQWKGIASSVRHFVRDALDFHFSLQAVEKVGLNTDPDDDGKVNEVTLGNVSALAAFVTMTRPPQQQIPPDQKSAVDRGQQLFGSGSGNLNCVSCHMPQLTINNPYLTIDNPGIPSATQAAFRSKAMPTLVNAQQSEDDLPVIQKFKRYYNQFKGQIAQQERQGVVFKSTDTPEELRAVIQEKKAIFDQIVAAGERGAAKKGEALTLDQRSQSGYTIPLTPTDSTLPSYIFPRLPQNSNSTITVPLYSDLRTHNMGKALSDIVSQSTDVAGISVAPPYFLTRPLWGVADTGPWLHDGRARSLQEAIANHANLSNPNDGSEAASAVQAFNNLSSSDKSAVIQFLNIMRLPIQPNLTIQN